MTLVEYDIDPLGSSTCITFNGTNQASYISESIVGNLVPGNNDFILGMYVKINSKAATFAIAGVWADTAPNADKRSWLLYYNQPTDRLRFAVSTAGTAASIVNLDANTFGSPSTGVWYFVVCGVVGGNSFIKVNDVGDSTACGYPFNTGTSIKFTLGWRTTDGVTGTQYAPIHVDQAYYFHTDILSDAEQTAWYNSGTGIDRRAFIDAGYNTPYAGWDFEDPVTSNRLGWGTSANTTLFTLNAPSYTTGHIVTQQFTSINAAVTYAIANKVAGDEWVFNCLSGYTLTYVAVSLVGIATNSSGWLRFTVDDNNYHAGDVNGGAYCLHSIAIANSYVEVTKLRTTTAAFNTTGSSISNMKITRCILSSFAQAFVSNGNLTAFEFSNNIVRSSARGIWNRMGGSTGASVLQGVIARNIFIGVNGLSNWGIYNQFTGTTETFSVEAYDNICVEYGDTKCIFNSGAPSTDNRVFTNNATNDSTGNITGVVPADIFVNFAGADYETKKFGDTYRTGVAVAGISVDILGRSLHNPPDVGAFEARSPAVLVSTPSSKDFGSVDKNDSEPSQDFEISNTGEEDATSVSSSVPTGFEVVYDLPSSIAAGGSETLTIKMKTNSTGLKSGNAQIESSVDTVDIALLGTVLGGATTQVKNSFRHGIRMGM